MKRFVAVCAAFSFGGVASAQSSVTLFGVLDASVSGYSTKSNFYAPPGLPLLAVGVPNSLKQSQTALSNSNYTSSRLGFRGTEDLGGGLAAGFWLEAGISNDDGVKGINNFNRRSTISLSGPFGEIRAGRDYAPSYWNDAVFDPFNANGAGANLIQFVSINIAASRTPALPTGLSISDNYVRASNSIGYYLPPNLGGFYGNIQYAFHENVKSDWVAGSPSKRGGYVGGRVGYAKGALDVALAYGVDNKDGGTAGFKKDRIKTLNFGATYDFGPAKLFGELSQVKDQFATETGVVVGGVPFSITHRGSDKFNGALIGVTVPVGAGLIRASYGRVKYSPDGAEIPSFLSSNRNASASKISLGYVYNLSKRTALYASAARTNLKDAQNSSVLGLTTVGGSPSYGRSFSGAVYVPKSAMGYDLGIRHSF